MDKHFTVTIHDHNGVKQFNVHRFVKKALLYFLGFILSIIFISVGTILYLDFSVDKMQEKKKLIEEKNKKLQLSIAKTNTQLQQRKKELDAFSDSLNEIEILIGISHNTKSSLEQRINDTKLNTQHRVTLLQLIPNGSPVAYHGITSKFGTRTHPILKRKEFHRGIDLKAKMNTPVYATADGIVEYAGKHKKSGFGRLVILSHFDGFKTYYGHLNKVVVKSHRFVKKGDLIAYSGNSGVSNGPHLHYEIRFIHKPLNPFWFIKWTVENYKDIFDKEKGVPWQSLITATAHLRVRAQTQTQLSLLPEQK